MNKPKTSGCRVCGSKIYSRGLCQVHYRRFMAKMKAMGAREAELFEARAVRDGWIIAKSRGGRPKDRDPFDELADQIEAEQLSEEEIAAEIAAVEKEITRATRKKKGQ